MNNTVLTNKWDFSFDYQQLCTENLISLTMYNATFNLLERNDWNVTISKAWIYAPIVISCDTEAINTNVYAYFYNVDTYLDNRYGHCYIIGAVYICAAFLALGILIFAINLKKMIKLKIHIILLITCIVSIANIIIETVNLTKISKNGNSDILLFCLDLSVSVIFSAMLYVSSFMIAGGWSIDTNYINWWRMLAIIILSPFSHSFLFYAQFYGVNEFIVIPFLVQMFSIYVICWLTVQQLHSNELKLMAYEFLIKTLGFNPSSTIISSKLIRSYIYLIIFLIFMIVKILTIVILYFFQIDLWIRGLIHFSTDYIYLLSLIFMSLPYKTTLNIFNMFFDDKDAYQDCERRYLDPMKFADVPLRDWNEHEQIKLIPPILQKLAYTATDFKIEENDQPLLDAR